MARARIQTLVVAQALCVLAGLIAGCTEDSPCDEGQTLRDGYCYVVDAAVPADAAVSTNEAGAASAFGKVCATSTDCVAPATYCAIQPPQTSGFCSAFGCDLDASICPSGWGCMDLTPFGLAQHMCIPGA